MKTTLNKIREFSPCQKGWSELLRSLNKTSADDDVITIVQVLDSNGLNDALWCLRAVSGYEKEIRLYAVWCARKVEHLMTDKRSKDALNVAERYANGQASNEELVAAWAAARDARDAARDAAWDAALAAAWDAARDASDAASTARDAASDAWDAASDAALAAANTAASDAVLAAASTARAAASAAAGDAASIAQETELRRLCAEIKSRELA